MKKANTIAALTIGLMLTASSLPTATQAQSVGKDAFPDPVDAQNWKLPDDMTWDEYQEIPGIDWNDTDIEPDEEFKGALIFVDFPDLDFVATLPEGSDPMGNPQEGSSDIPREEIPKFYNEFLNTPQASNNYQTINGFWMENSSGKWGADFDNYGPYRLDHNEFQYGMGEWGQEANMPAGYEPKNLFNDAHAAAEADMEASGVDYDFKFIVHAGYDESGIWQEAGEMMFDSREDVTDEFGPPSEYEGLDNWAKTRYVPWSSWFAAKAIWSRARGDSSIQAENSGMAVFAHEFGHIKSLGDNYNNPYGDPASRSYSGAWELMSRGAFAGPGGPHTRWMIPSALGASSPSHHMLRNKIKQGFLDEDDYLQLDRDELKATGPAFADVTSRATPFGDDFDIGGLRGINITMDEDLTPVNSLEDDWRADMQNGADWYDNYTLEVVDRVGTDSFQADAGVLMAKTKDAERAPFIWVVDSHPEDFNEVDFERPDGSDAMMSKGDYRQLSNALFHAGTGPDVVSEYTDEDNRLHFYILDKNRDDAGNLHYQTAVRHMDGAGSYDRGVDAEASTSEPAEAGRVATYHFDVTNTGEETDLVRVKAETKAGWELQLDHNVVEIDPGETVSVPVYVDIPEGSSEATELTFTATSETDNDQSTTVKTTIQPVDNSANGLISLVESLDNDDAFENDAVVRALNTHLKSVAHYEKQGQDNKVIKHMEGFKTLLNKQQGKMSEAAYEELKAGADQLIGIYQ